MNPFVKLMRPLNCLISSFSVPIVMITLFGTDFVSRQTLLFTAIGMMVVFFFTAAGNTLNDYMDRKTDEINHPGRPIPSGKVEPKTALVYSGVMFGIGVILSFLLELWIPQIIVASAVILMIAYETRFKKEGLAGNLIISALTGMVFIFGGSIYGKLYLPTLLGLLAFLATVGREIVKDIQDLKGDINRKTFPMRVGPRKAEMTASFFIVGGVILSPFPYIFGSLSLSYLLVVLVADAIFIYSLLLLKSAERSQKFIKLAMVVALIAFLIGGLI
ncbi:MAG: UbiA family prenyltransferase [Candidatus Thermoplasmatota archaeon]|nr:UbiA family prenyltransferase [Candidatus Thermoplasmatota archaeon]